MTAVETPAPDTTTGAPSAAATTGIRVRDLGVAFDGRSAVQGVTFDLAPGRCVALVGESGSGKSVSARSLLGLSGANATVTASELSLDGEDLLAATPAQWRAIRGGRIGLVHQDALVSLDPLRPVGAEIAETLRLHTDLARRDRRAEVVRLLASVGVPEPEQRAKQRPDELSGGLRQRALIASAIAGRPDYIVADEPTTALDVTVQAQVLRLLAELRDAGTGLLLVSHDLAVVGELADEILVLRGGEVVERGTPDEVLGSPRTDYTRRLLDAVPSSHTRGERLSDVPPVEIDTALVQPVRDLGVPLLEASGLTKRYRRGRETVTVVDAVDVRLERGRTLGVVGESGSGKSTLAGMLLGLVEPDGGTVSFEGEAWVPLPEPARRARRHRIQSISQDPLSSFDPRYRVHEVLGEVLAAIGVRRDARRERAAALLDQVGLAPELLDRAPLTLSGGQRQRVAIAAAIAVGPDVLVCDEPVAALDVSVQAQVLDLLGDLQRRLGLGIVFISHDLGVVHHLADEVLVMHHGEVVERGDVDAVLTAPQQPYTRELLGAVPRLRSTLERNTP
ncbi:ABC transporter ATP-binding protein [Pseudoclavibacter chungangensis]|uniref:ABC transporter ATP-binding protein n=1 Tax=Pseudoclavibacter chungangensis TaxID=587635 RepID=A0A7J5C0U7_9MICO|nr:ABC transporter ATP-binding protein [Pseudoclavibacter chungangensis]KAB1662245.1 ABC transporter ATP-binding protein [Pseudoclavibacter chungangensis]NYJ65450.1 peptide/nickel transport system ATP-binding protein [Pseudoclavibacter chungangensis]